MATLTHNADYSCGVKPQSQTFDVNYSKMNNASSTERHDHFDRILTSNRWFCHCGQYISLFRWGRDQRGCTLAESVRNYAHLERFGRQQNVEMMFTISISDQQYALKLGSSREA